MKDLLKSGSKTQLVQEGLDELDLNAKEELDGEEIDLDAAEADIDVGIEKQDIEEKNGYDIRNISDQLDGMIEHWFELAQKINPEKKESFLKLGDRLSELSDVLKTEFIDA